MAEPTPVVRLKAGVVEDAAGGTHVVNCDGTRISPAWAGLIPTAGDAVKVLLVDGAAIAWNAATGPRPGRGTVAGAASGGLLPINTASGQVQAMYTGTAPSLNTEVFLDWQMTTPRVLAGVAVVVPPPSTPDPTPPPPGPPPTVVTGTLEVPAVTSNSRTSTGGWGTSGVRQGSWSGRSYQGGWFYGAAPRQIAGRTVTRLRIRLSARNNQIGNYNQPLDLQFHLHPHESQPSGDLGVYAGPHVWTMPARYGGGDWLDLPTAWGQLLVDNGGGVALSGGSYGGLAGRDSDPNSGFLLIDWRA